MLHLGIVNDSTLACWLALSGIALLYNKLQQRYPLARWISPLQFIVLSLLSKIYIDVVALRSVRNGGLGRLQPPLHNYWGGLAPPLSLYLCRYSPFYVPRTICLILLLVFELYLQDCPNHGLPRIQIKASFSQISGHGFLKFCYVLCARYFFTNFTKAYPLLNTLSYATGGTSCFIF